MKLEQVMDLQYRKLLSARDQIREGIEAEMEGSLLMQISVVLLLAPLLVDLDSLSYPELDERQTEIVSGYLDVLLKSDDPGITLSLYPEDIEELFAIAGTNRISDEWNRRIALMFVDAANEIFPDYYVGKEHLAEIL